MFGFRMIQCVCHSKQEMLMGVHICGVYIPSLFFFLSFFSVASDEKCRTVQVCLTMTEPYVV